MRDGLLMGARIEMRDRKDGSSFVPIGVVTEQAGYDSEGSEILLYDVSPDFLLGFLSGMGVALRFRKPGLVLDWDAFCTDGTLRGIRQEAMTAHVLFTGAPRTIEADDEWRPALDDLTRTLALDPWMRTERSTA